MSMSARAPAPLADVLVGSGEDGNTKDTKGATEKSRKISGSSPCAVSVYSVFQAVAFRQRIEVKSLNRGARRAHGESRTIPDLLIRVLRTLRVSVSPFFRG